MKILCFSGAIRHIVLMLGLVWAGQAIAISYANSNLTILNPDGATFGGTNDIEAQWDGSLNTSVSSTNFNMSIASVSNYNFFGFPITYHHVRVLGPGSYAFDTSCTADQVQSTGGADCGGAPNEFLELTIPEGMIGAHFLWDWNVTKDIDTVLLWDMNAAFQNPLLYYGPAGPTPAEGAVYSLVSVDGDGDGFPGVDIIDGPFLNFSMNLNMKLSALTVDIDIKPGGDENTINLSSAGVVPVAILSSETFDATTVDPSTVSLAGASVRMVGRGDWSQSYFSDVNGDGRVDFVCHVNTAQFMIEAGQSIAVMEAMTSDGTPIRGEDTIRIVPDM